MAGTVADSRGWLVKHRFHIALRGYALPNGTKFTYLVKNRFPVAPPREVRSAMADRTPVGPVIIHADGQRPLSVVGEPDRASPGPRRCRARRVRQGAVRTQKFSSMTALTSYRRKPNARYLPSRDGRGSKIHAGPTGPLSIVFALPSRLTEAIWNVSPTVPET